MNNGLKQVYSDYGNVFKFTLGMIGASIVLGIIIYLLNKAIMASKTLKLAVMILWGIFITLMILTPLQGIINSYRKGRNDRFSKEREAKRK